MCLKVFPHLQLLYMYVTWEEMKHYLGLSTSQPKEDGGAVYILSVSILLPTPSS